ncbi:Heparin sulfate O-sulfotransferase [Fasciola hepatica]|uniref:Heparin sulfate O-sulfotransferase n=1 Tax=Fasciola hepatica TaxID=6192 RepID=A0A4E0RVQ2_FASHE|nr:Heparin sulfate O-sulfotransferase [Fasciola hepatica]
MLHAFSSLSSVISVRRIVYLGLAFLLLALGNVLLGLFFIRPADLPPSMLSSVRGVADLSPSYDQLVIYNRIPKTGSTSLVNLVYHLWKQNSVRIALLNVSHNGLFLNRMNQLYLVWNLTERVSAQQPLFLHGHFVYLNFAQFGSPIRPIYLNMIRDPLERLASYYYFIRFGDDFRPNLTRRRMSNPNQRILTFDECVQTGGVDCTPNDLWVQVPFFCGHEAYCRVPGNPAALETAKRRITDSYLLVGLSEAFDEYVLLLEQLLPRFFSGAIRLLRASGGWHLRRTKHKLPITETTRALFRNDPVWRAEQEFYEFVRTEFWAARNALFRGPPLRFQTSNKNQPIIFLNNSDNPVDRIKWSRQRFFFAKVRPREDYDD